MLVSQPAGGDREIVAPGTTMNTAGNIVKVTQLASQANAVYQDGYTINKAAARWRPGRRSFSGNSLYVSLRVVYRDAQLN